jgi:hypothetical protein
MKIKRNSWHYIVAKHGGLHIFDSHVSMCTYNYFVICGMLSLTVLATLIGYISFCISYPLLYLVDFYFHFYHFIFGSKSTMIIFLLIDILLFFVVLFNMIKVTPKNFPEKIKNSYLVVAFSNFKDKICIKVDIED